jgi:hypothetical protein
LKGEYHPDPVLHKENALREIKVLALNGLLKARRHLPKKEED